MAIITRHDYPKAVTTLTSIGLLASQNAKEPVSAASANAT